LNHRRVAGHGDDLLEEGWGFTPKCMMDDAERFRGCLSLSAVCRACGEVYCAVTNQLSLYVFSLLSG
jgi:hypothetical protein